MCSCIFHAFVMYLSNMYNVCAFLRGVRLSLNHLRHADFTVFLEGIHHQTIAADVVNAL